MRVTVDLPDELLIAAKKRAAELRRPLRALIERGLRAELGRLQTGPQKQGDKIHIKWVTVEGGLPDNLNTASRSDMHDWLRRTR